MATPKRKISKTRRDKRRSHHALSAKSFISCPNCGESILPNRVCHHCGYYKGKQILNLEEE